MSRTGLREIATAIGSHPRFPAAARGLVGEFVDLRTRRGALNRVVANLGRENVIEHLLFLHFARGVRDSENGATFERLTALSEARDRIGARAVRTELRLLQIAGFVVQSRSRNDGRLRIYEPTPLLVEHARDYYAMLFGVFDELLPGARVRARLRDDPEFIGALLERAGRAYLSASWAPRREGGAFQQLLRLDGARPILAVVIDCHWRRWQLPTPQQLAARFYVSSSQARIILKTAAAKGLIVLGPRGRLVDASRLVEEGLRTQCRSLAFFAKFGLELDDRLLASVAHVG